MKMSSNAQKAANRRQDAKRPQPVSVRFTAPELAALDADRQPGESRGQAVRRIVTQKSPGHF
jgi:hypothetical protein